MTELFTKITLLLDKNAVRYDILHHEATPTSEESAKARGESLNIGAKALLMKADDFILCVIPANKRLNSKALKHILNTKNIRFATPEELKELTGLEKGAVPPFGSFMGMDMLVDESLFDETYMAFNAGSLTTSIKMRTQDYKKVVSPLIEKIAE